MHVFVPLFFNAPLGGLQSHVRGQVDALAGAGHAATVMCKPGPFATSLREAGVEVLTTTFEHIPQAVAQACGAGRYDLVHAHPFRSREVGLAVSREQRIPLLVTFHGTYADSLPTYIDEVTTVIAVSHAIRDYLVRHAGCPPERVVVIPNGVDTAVFHPHRPDGALLATGLPGSLPASSPTDRRVLLISRLDEDKRFLVDTVIDAWREVVRHRMFDLTWWVAGEGTLRGEMMEEAERLNHKAGRQRVSFLGWQDEPALASLCHACHLVIAPGRAALEAMACEKPVIAMGSKGYVGLVESGVALNGAYGNFGGFGHRHEGYAPGSLLADIDRVIYDDERLERLGHLSQSLVNAFFRQDDLDRQLVSLYEAVRSMRLPHADTGSMKPRLLDCPALRFSCESGTDSPRLAWVGPPRSPRWNLAITEQSYLSVRCDLDPEEKCYIQGDPGGFDRPPRNPEAWRMDSERDYVFKIPVRLGEPAPDALFWVIEYDGERRLRHTTTKLVDGLNSLSLRSSAETTSFRLAIRFTGRGGMQLGPIGLFGKDEPLPLGRCAADLQRVREVTTFGSFEGQNLVFIVGPPRSGTTWLLKLLSSHPDVAAADVDSLGVRINDNQTLETNVFNDNRPFTDAQIRYKFFTFSRQFPGKIIVEKTPIHLLFINRIIRVFPRAALLLTERDGRDVANSLIQVGRNRSSWWEGAPDTMEKAASLWRQYALAAARCEENYCPLKVRYEDLLENPSGELSRILTCLGLSTGHIETQLDACREGRNIPIPGVFREGKRGGWTREFKEEDVAVFKAVAGDLLVRLGYEKDNNWRLPVDASR